MRECRGYTMVFEPTPVILYPVLSSVSSLFTLEMSSHPGTKTRMAPSPYGNIHI